MPRNGSGTYSLPEAPFVAGTVISSTAVNSDLSDIATALTGSLPVNGEKGMTGQLKAADGSLLLPGITFSNDTNTGFYRPAEDQISVVIGGVQVGLFTSTGLNNGIPVATVLDFAGSSTPTYFLLCYGQNVLRASYPALFTAISTTYGSGDGVTTFGLPDLRGSAIFGKDDMGGSAASRLTTTFFGTDPTVLGNRGGSQSKVILSANLPAYTPAGTITNGTISLSNATVSGTSALGAALFNAGGNIFGSYSSVTVGASQGTSTFAGTAQGGSATAFSLVTPALIMNKIIFAGA